METEVLTDAEGLRAARAHLRDVVPLTHRLWTGPLPGVRDVRVTHVEDGWVDLSFHRCTEAEARAVAGELLHPDALATDDFIMRLTDEDGLHFQGFGWDDDPPDGVPSRSTAPDPPPRIAALQPKVEEVPQVHPRS